MSNDNGAIKSERYNGTLIVYVPPVKWYQLGVPYHSELERILRPAAEGDEPAIVVAPDKVTLKYLKLESYPSNVTMMMDGREAHRLADLSRYKGSSHSSNGNGNDNGYNGNGSGNNGNGSNGNHLP